MKLVKILVREPKMKGHMLHGRGNIKIDHMKIESESMDLTELDSDTV
jgi:hypothetical protein